MPQGTCSCVSQLIKRNIEEYTKKGSYLDNHGNHTYTCVVHDQNKMASKGRATSLYTLLSYTNITCTLHTTYHLHTHTTHTHTCTHTHTLAHTHAHTTHTHMHTHTHTHTMHTRGRDTCMHGMKVKGLRLLGSV